jgi:hypothetical protein
LDNLARAYLRDGVLAGFHDSFQDMLAGLIAKVHKPSRR